MADDDRYRWLDDEAAERLLHGSAVNARSTRPGGRQGSDHDNVEAAPTSTYERPADATPFWARGGTAPRETGGSVPEQRTREDLDEDRLASLLDSLVAEQTATLHALGAARTGTVVGDARGELPGEAAAVEAFRAAQPEMSLAHNGTVDISAGPTESGTLIGRRAVREGGRRSRRRRSEGARRTPLVGRPLRAGFAMAVAGCALGGAAVAAGAGVIPTPFGGGGAPAASVSPMVSPGDERDEASRGNGSPYDGNGPRRGTREDGSPSGSPSGEDLAGKERGRDGNHSKDPKGNEDWLDGDGKGLSESDKKAMARALCGAYEDNELSLQYRLRLEAAAGGPEGVKKFCDKHDSGRGEQTTAGVGNSGGVGAPGDPGGTGGTSSGEDGGDDGGDSGGAESGGDDSGGSDGGETDGGPGGSRPDSGGESDGASAGAESSPSPDGSETTPTPTPTASVSASAGS